MRVMVFAKATESSEKGAPPPTPEAFAAMDRFIEELVKAGVFVAGAGLQNSAQAKRIVCLVFWADPFAVSLGRRTSLSEIDTSCKCQGGHMTGRKFIRARHWLNRGSARKLSQ